MTNTNYKQDGVDLVDRYVNRSELLLSDVGMWSCGSNANGQLGIGTTDSSSHTQWSQISNLSGWTIYNNQQNLYARRSDGQWFCWGSNINGSLGIGDIDLNGRISPVAFPPMPAGASTTVQWANVNGCGGAGAAVRTDGTAWVWGSNNAGNLGLSNVTPMSTPVQLGALTNWVSIQMWGDDINQGISSLAVKTNGTLWSWGQNDAGQLGNGNRTNRSSPVQVGALTTWKQIAVGDKWVVGVTTGGTLWSWGDNFWGTLADPGISARSSPVQIGALTTWSKVYGLQTVCFGIKTDGTLWSWGRNDHGHAGNGTTNSYDSPVQCGAATDWDYIVPGLYVTYGVKTDGTLWGCGNPVKGSLGPGITTTQTSFVKLSVPTKSGTVTSASHTWQGYYLAEPTLVITGGA